MAQIENAPLVFINRVARHKPENIRHTDGYCPFCHPETRESSNAACGRTASASGS